MSVCVIDMPDLKGLKKTGADDLLVHEDGGVDRMLAIIAEARPYKISIQEILEDSGTKELTKDSSSDAIENALRSLISMLQGLDELTRELAQSEAINHLESIGIKNSKKLVNAALKSLKDGDAFDTSESENSQIPSGFDLREDGLYCRISKKWQWLCGRLEVIGKSRDKSNEEWGRWVRFADDDGNVKTERIAMAELHGDISALWSKLASLGLNISKSRTASERLATYITRSGTQDRIRTTKRVGWYNNVFVFPDETISADGNIAEKIIYTGSRDSLLRQAGTIDEWKNNVGRFCTGNSRLVFSVSVGFAGSLIFIANEQGGGFHLHSSSSQGKSTTLRVAGSILGGGGELGFAQSWRSTANALEYEAEAHNDLTFVLDEIGEADPLQLSSAVYMLANGQGKGRAKSNGGLRERPDWKELVLSSGEITIGEHMASIGKRTRGGQDVRIINIPADAGLNLGIFENLHDFSDGDKFSRHLQGTSSLYFGTPIRAFIRHLVNHRDEISEQVRKYREKFIVSVIEGKNDVTGEVRRAAGRFALVAYAGELAREIGILPVADGEPEEAAKLLFEKWCSSRGTFGALDEERAVRQVRLFIEQHGASRFERELSSDEADSFDPEDAEKVINRAGYYRFREGQGQYWFLREVFRNEVCKGFDYLMTAKALAKRELILSGMEDEVMRYDLKRVVGPGHKKSSRVYIILEKILETD